MNRAKNVQAIREMNQRYHDTFGASAKNAMFNMLTIAIYIAIFLSIAASAFGIYYDLYLSFGFWVALLGGIVGGVIIEIMKAVFTSMAALYEEMWIKAIGVILLTISLSFAFVLHFKGATNSEKTAIVTTVSEIQKQNLMMAEKEQARKDKIVGIAEGIVKNGTIYDDKIAMKTLNGMNNYTNSLLSRGDISELDKIAIQETRNASESRADSMRVLFPIFEVLSIFGILKVLLVNYSVTSGIKNVSKEIETQDIEDAYIFPPETDDEIMSKRIIEMMRNKRKEQPNGSNSTHLLKNLQSAETPHTVDPNKWSNSSENLNNNINLEEMENEEQEEGAKSFKEQAKAKEEELFTIDLMKYPIGYNEVIKAMFDNGTLKKHDFLVPKEEVVKKLGITRAYYETVTYDLKKNKHIVAITGKGYMALSDLKNEVKTA